VKQSFRFLTMFIVALIVCVGFGFAGVAENNTSYSANGGNYIGSYNLIPQTYLAPATAATNSYQAKALTDAQIITMFAAGATTYTLAHGDFTGVITPRNLYCQTYFATGIGTSTWNGSLTATGVDVLGNTITETIALSTTPVAGVNAFISITSWSVYFDTTTFTQGGDTPALRVGVGTALGVTVSKMTASTDVKIAIENGARATTEVISTRYNTITPAASPNGSINYQYYILMKPNPR
jgi:hypothetical protein